MSGSEPSSTGRSGALGGVILAAMTDEGGVALPGADELAAAVAELDRLRKGLGFFDVALVTQGIPAIETIEMYQTCGVTWVLVTGWDHEVRDLATTRH